MRVIALVFLLTFLKSSLSITLTDLPWRPDGRCGPKYKQKDGQPGECSPHGRTPCCSLNTMWCGKSHEHCDCKKCIDYRKVKGPTSGLHRISLIQARQSPRRCESILNEPIDLEKIFSLHFDVLITKLPIQTTPKNIVRFSNGGDDIGDGGPAIYFNDGVSNKFRFYFFVNGEIKNFYSKNAYPTNHWVHIAVEQVEVTGRYYYIITIDGFAEHMVPQNHPSVINNVRIYFSGCDFSPIDAVVRDMVLYNGEGCPDGCGDHGRCTGKNKCQCDGGYEGKRCENDVSFHVRVGTPPWIADNEL